MEEMKKDKLIIYDTTLRDGEQAPGFRMNSNEKLLIAKALAELNVDIIEAGFPGSSKGDFESVKIICEEVTGPVISGLARCIEKDILACRDALMPAIARGKGKIHVFIATSNIHTENKLKKTKEEVIEMVESSVKLCKSITPLVEFSCEDFARSDLPFTMEVIKTAINAGANTINLPDTVGYRLPSEMYTMVKKVINEINNPEVIFSVHSHNDLGNATSNALYAVKAGARQIECTMNGIGERAGNTALEEVVANIIERNDYFDVKTNINVEKIVMVSKLLSEITGRNVQWNKPIVGKNAFRHSSGIHTDGVLKNKDTYEWIDPRRYGGKSEMPLTARSGKHQLIIKLQEKGFHFELESIDEIMERFKSLADLSNEVFDDVLLMAVKGDSKIPEYYNVKDFKAWFNKGEGSCRLKLLISGEEKEIVMSGNGMINAIEKAVKELTGLSFEIVEYSSRSLTKGGTSQGIERVILCKDGFTVKGIGISNDTVEGALKALVDGCNKLKYVIQNSIE